MNFSRRYKRIILSLCLMLVFGVLIGGIFGFFAANEKDIDTETKSSEIVTETKMETTTPEKTTSAQYTSLGEYKLTAYCPCSKCCGQYANNRPTDIAGNKIIYTASGTKAKAGRTVGVDPSVFPFGTKIIINGIEYVAEDTGSAVDGKQIDIYFETHEEAVNFGVQYAEVFLKEDD